MTPISAREIAELAQGTVVGGNPEVIIRRVIIDSRNTQPGDLFIAFQGAKVDGHQFALQAFEQGATAVLITRPVEDIAGLNLTPQADKAVIFTGDALNVLQQLAIRERGQFTGPVIGVTGSNGKTTTKDMIATVLSTGGACLATKGNLNTELGLPLTLLGRAGDEKTMVLEMGMRGLGQIAQLCEMAKPTTGIITNIGQSHLELLGSQENIAIAKGELLTALPADGTAVLAAGDEWLERIAPKCKGRVLWYGLATDADASATSIQATGTGTEFKAKILGKSVSVELPTRGQHNVVNALGALLVGTIHGMNLGAMADAMAHLPSSTGRLAVVSGHRRRTIIDDCYNASPLSMKASLQVLLEHADKGATTAILGDMFELGSYEEAGHHEVGAYCASIGVGQVITVGPLAEKIANEAQAQGHPNVRSYADKEALLQELEDVVPEGATVLVKASRGMALEDIVKVLAK